MPCHGSGGWSPVSHRGGPGSISVPVNVGIRGAQSGAVTGFSTSISVVPCRYHYTGALTDAI
jgi:hypothetical protein